MDTETEPQQVPIQVVVLTDFSDKSIFAVNHGKEMCRMLERGMTLAYFDNEKNEDETLLQDKYKAFIDKAGVDAKFHIIKGKPAKGFEDVVPQVNAIIVVACINTEDKNSLFAPANLLKILHHSRIPYLLVNDDLKEPLLYKHLVLPIDSTKESKEKVLWASYFGRFNESKVSVLAGHYKDEYLLKYLNNNLKFINKMFNNFEVSFEVIKSTHKQDNMDAYALDYAKENNAGLIIILTTESYSLIDRLKGPYELKIVTNTYKLPVLCLNRRDDLYVMCD